MAFYTARTGGRHLDTRCDRGGADSETALNYLNRVENGRRFNSSSVDGDAIARLRFERQTCESDLGGEAGFLLTSPRGSREDFSATSKTMARASTLFNVRFSFVAARRGVIPASPRNCSSSSGNHGRRNLMRTNVLRFPSGVQYPQAF